MAGEDIAADPKFGSREELQQETTTLESKRKQYKKALKTAKYRSIIRDENEKYREAMAERMKWQEAKAVYRRRVPLAETIFGYVKGVLGTRQFLTRGIDNVRTEWRWICTAYNLRVLLKRQITWTDETVFVL